MILESKGEVMDRRIEIYIHNKEKEYIEQVDEEIFNEIEKYKPFYNHIRLKSLKNIFAYLHFQFNSLFRELNSERERLNADPSRYLLKIIDEFETLEHNLKKSEYEFKIDTEYKNKIIECNDFLKPTYGSDIPSKFTKIKIVETKPIFELCNNQALELFQKLIRRIYDKDEDLGKIFQSKVRYKSFQNDTLEWETMISEDEKKLLKNNWSYIKKCIYEIFGSKVKIKNKSVTDIDVEKNNRINQTNEIVRKKMNKQEEKIKQKFSDKKIEYNFKYKNILLKGVTGTGKSRMIDNIIINHLNLKEEHQETNVLRVNIHSASSNTDLMQGIGISSSENGNIEYNEKQGLILELMEKAIFMPSQPFVLILEEIQENSLNELIGDLIYLIEDSKRAKGYKADNKEYTYMELIDNIMKQNQNIHSIKLPSLISQEKKFKRMIIPKNLFIFCTSNYRDDRKVIEDNLLRRFEVIEIYPKYSKEMFLSIEVSKFLEELNKSIVSVCKSNGEIHSDRFMIGHSIWLKVENKEDFSRAFLKVITEFKDVKDMYFDDFQKIVKDLKFPFEVEKEYENYEAWIEVLQTTCYDFLK